MNIGIICEYSPFHNGHLYHINKIKEMYKDCNIILVMSSLFLERGEVSILDKWDKTEIALNMGVDVVVELPFIFSSQSADIFAYGAIEILKNMNVDKIVFGSEINDIRILNEIASIQINNKEFDNEVKNYLDEGFNYPTSLSKAINDKIGYTVDNPNDLLGISYIKQILLQKANIEPICIKRTSDFNSKKLTGTITSASSIREAIKKNKSIKKYVPNIVYKYLKNNTYFNEDYLLYLKYKIISEIDNLNSYQTVDEGIEGRIKKYIFESNNWEELVNKIKTKRYTYNKINRMLIHILCGFTKKEASKYKHNEYIRILGFNENGKKHLNKIKKNSNLPIITGYSNTNSEILNIEYRVSNIYYMANKEKNKTILMKREYQNSPIIK
ncbi:MAG TPA: nucleotidyltransferase [Bacilli bacterium]|nr:nucleotidyltransferase [Bacilli bacterium]